MFNLDALNSNFVRYRISKNALEKLIESIDKNDKSKIKFENNIVYIHKTIYKKYHVMFYHNAKGADNRKNAGKLFHFDHNPSNKKVLSLLNEKIKAHKNESNFLDELATYIKSVQTIDLITVDEDDIRTSKDLVCPNGPLTSKERDDLLNTTFYELKDL